MGIVACELVRRYPGRAGRIRHSAGCNVVHASACVVLRYGTALSTSWRVCGGWSCLRGVIGGMRRWFIDGFAVRDCCRNTWCIGLVCAVGSVSLIDHREVPFTPSVTSATCAATRLSRQSVTLSCCWRRASSSSNPDCGMVPRSGECQRGQLFTVIMIYRRHNRRRQILNNPCCWNLATSLAIRKIGRVCNYHFDVALRAEERHKPGVKGSRGVSAVVCLLVYQVFSWVANHPASFRSKIVCKEGASHDEKSGKDSNVMYEDWLGDMHHADRQRTTDIESARRWPAEIATM